MAFRTCRCSLGIGVLAALLLVALPGVAQRPRNPQVVAPGGQGSLSDSDITATLIVYVRDESGGANSQIALVTISRMEGGMLKQAATEVGQAEFDNLFPGLYTVQVSAPGYDSARETVNAAGGIVIAHIQLRPSATGGSAGTQGPPRLPLLSPKAQKLLANVLEALRAHKPANARADLEQAYRLAPGHPDVNYLYGVYEAEMNDLPRAMSYWETAVNIFPTHMGSLMFLSDALLRENKSAEAVSYLDRAIEAEPTAWRPHAMIAQAYSNQGKYQEAIKEADRALELGHGQALSVQPLLARALVAQGNKQRAIEVLQNYLKERPANAAAQKMLNSLRAATPPDGATPAQPSRTAPDFPPPL